MDYWVCLSQLRQLGVSEGSISLVRSFPEDRTMTDTIGNHEATMVAIHRGSPQGSVLDYLYLYPKNHQVLPAGPL